MLAFVVGVVGSFVLASTVSADLIGPYVPLQTSAVLISACLAATAVLQIVEAVDNQRHAISVGSTPLYGKGEVVLYCLIACALIGLIALQIGWYWLIW